MTSPRIKTHLSMDKIFGPLPTMALSKLNALRYDAISVTHKSTFHTFLIWTKGESKTRHAPL